MFKKRSGSKPGISNNSHRRSTGQVPLLYSTGTSILHVAKYHVYRSTHWEDLPCQSKESSKKVPRRHTVACLSHSTFNTIKMNVHKLGKGDTVHESNLSVPSETFTVCLRSTICSRTNVVIHEHTFSGRASWKSCAWMPWVWSADFLEAGRGWVHIAACWH